MLKSPDRRQPDAEIRPSMAHKMHQNFARNMYIVMYVRVCVCVCMYFKSHLACSGSGILKKA